MRSMILDHMEADKEGKMGAGLQRVFAAAQATRASDLIAKPFRVKGKEVTAEQIADAIDLGIIYFTPSPFRASFAR